VLVLGGILGSQIPRFIENDVTLAASSADKLQAIEDQASAIGRTATVHLTIDTGMERIGVHWYSAERLLEASLRCRHVRVEGIFTHFANADARDLGQARLQLERFHDVLRFYERRSSPSPLRHAANSGAILQLRESHGRALLFSKAWTNTDGQMAAAQRAVHRGAAEMTILPQRPTPNPRR
jgi:alanine racemase